MTTTTTASTTPNSTPTPSAAASPATSTAKKAVRKPTQAKPVAVKPPVAKKAPAAKKAQSAKKAVSAKKAAPARKLAPAKKAGVKTSAAKKPTAWPAPDKQAVSNAKTKKPKLVRDSFTIPKAEYLVLEELKQRAAKLARPIKKSELLRAGIKALAAMNGSAFLAALDQVPAIKTGRPAA